MGKWEKVRLGDVAKVQGGYAFVSSSFVKEGVPLIRIGNIKENCVKIDKDVCYPEKFWNEHPEYRVVENNILIAMSGATVGKLGIFKTNKRALLNQRVGNIVPNIEKIEQKYLFHYLTSIQFKRYIDVTAFGCAQPNISGKQIMDFPILLPPLEIQQKIAATLDIAAALLKLRQQQLVELEALIQSVFYQMFGNEKDISQWTCKKIQDIANVTVGVVIKPAQYYTDKEEGIRAFRSLNVGKMKVKDENWVYFTTEGHIANKKSELKLDDVLIVRSGNPGISCVVTEEFRGCNAIDIIIARPDKIIIEPIYLCAFTNFPHGKNQIIEKTGGTAQQHFNVGAYKNMTIALPPLPLQTQFAAIVQKIDQQKALVQQSIDETQTLFDSLMSQYFD